MTAWKETTVSDSQIGDRFITTASKLPLRLTSPRVQYGLCVPIGFCTPFKYEIQSSLKGDTIVKIIRHISITLIPAVLAIYYCSHLFHGRHDLVLVRNTVVQPIGDMLT